LVVKNDWNSLSRGPGAMPTPLSRMPISSGAKHAPAAKASHCRLHAIPPC
jgi:hypothetical protein